MTDNLNGNSSTQRAGNKSVFHHQKRTWQCCRSAPLGRESTGRDSAHIVVETFLRNWVKCPYWHSFSTRAHSLLDPIHAIARTIVNGLAARGAVRASFDSPHDPTNALKNHASLPIRCYLFRPTKIIGIPDPTANTNRFSLLQ